jgi:hypothetical protein
MSGEVLEGEVFVAQQGDVDPGEVVKFTQRLRYQMVGDLTNHGAKISGDNKELASLLRDMDRSALTQRELNIQEDSRQDGRVAIEAYAKFRGLVGKDPFTQGGTVQRRRDPTEGVVLPQVELVPGEDHQGEFALNIDDYVSPET